ncbi:thioester-containing protein 1 allele R1-like [Armigeres subalbatus]|uniref:thioester-containing protein 1 allele R1-like n=1 Tax=Armigeres subalbatus TaxID=124917 RepID=UPI002ED07865
MWSIIIFALCYVLKFFTAAISNDGGFYIMLVPTIVHEHSTATIALSTMGFDKDEKYQVELRKTQLTDDGNTKIRNVEISQGSDTKLVHFEVPALENVPHHIAAHFPGKKVEEFNVKVKKRPIMVLIQTDKPIYKPGDTVKFRVLVLNHLTRPIDTLKSVNVQLRDGDGNLIREWPYAKLRNGVFQSQIDLAYFIPLGRWTFKVQALNTAVQDKTFDVAEYVLPLHEIRIRTSKRVVFKDEFLELIIDAQYTFGKPIKGVVFLNFGKIVYPTAIQLNGHAVEKIPMNALVSAKDFSDDEYRLPVNVKIEEASSGRVYETSETIPIHTQSHKITLRKSSEYLLQEESIRFWLTLTDPDGEPLANPSTMTINVTQFSFNKHQTFEELPDADGVVSLMIDSSNTTDRIELEVTYDGEKTKFEVLREKDNDRAFLKASLLAVKPMLHQNVEVLVQSSFRMNLLLYHVISQGEIMASGRVNVDRKRTATFNFTTNFSMVPEASLVVFAIYESRLWSDVIRFKVHELNNFVGIELSSNSTEPRAKIGLTVKSKPGSMVGLLAADRSLLKLGTGNDITQKLVLDRLGEPRIGEDDDIKKLGFTVLTNAFYQTHYEYDYFMPEMRFSYDDTVFNTLVRIDHNEGAQMIRKYFPETWLWTDMVQVDGSGKLDLNNIVPDTITSWAISAFAIDEAHGLGVTKSPVSLTVVKAFFITVNLPYSIVKTETATVEVFVHNYLDRKQTAIVRIQVENGSFEIVDEADSVISNAEDSEAVTVAENSVQKVIFLLKPTQSGNPTITILANSADADDAVQRNLRVTPGGLQYFENTARFIEVDDSSIKFSPFLLMIPRTATPGSESITFSVEGVLLGSAIANLGHIIRLPSGCGEQNLLNLVPSVIALEYMSKAGTLTNAIKAKAIGFLQKGYQNQLKYKLRDGSFSVFGENDGRGSVFLTALVAKVFRFAEKHITVDRDVVQKAFDWLRNKQASDGRFIETGRILYKSLQGGLNEGVTLTSYILVAFLEHKTLARKYLSVVQKGADFISNHYKSMENAYDLALAAYVLQLANHHRKEAFFDKLLALSQSDDEKTLRWWESGSTSIETTAYALLTYMNRGSYIDAKSIMKWLVSQRYDKGGYDNTQNTFVGLQALAQYSGKMSISNHNYDVAVSYDNEQHQFHMDSVSSLNGHHLAIPSHVRRIEVSVNGTGAGVFQIAHKYNKEAEDNSPRFKIEKTFNKTTFKNGLNMHICATFQPKRRFEETNMVLIEIMFPSGYIVTKDFQQQMKRNKLVRKTETDDDDTKLILYFDPLQPNEPVCVDVEAFQKAIVLNQAHGWIKVYDYYDSTREAIEYFDPVVN